VHVNEPLRKGAVSGRGGRAALALALLLALALRAAAAYDIVPGPPPQTDTDLRWHAFRRFTSHDGLPQNTIYALAQDRAGFIYAGTEEGLARYDGHRWQRLPYPAAVARQRPFVSTLAAMPDGSIWVGTDNAGLLRDVDGTLVVQPLSGASAAPDIEALHADGARVWVGTSKGLYLCEGDACREIAAARGLQVAALLLGRGVRGESLFIGTNNSGLYRLDDPYGAASLADWQLTRDDGLPNSAVRALAQWGGADGMDLWIATGRGLARLSGTRLTQYTPQQGLPSGGIRALLPSVDRDGRPVLWAACGYGGLVEFHADGSWRHTGRENGLSDDALLALLSTDAERRPPVLWIGSTHGGVLRYEHDAWAALDERNGLPHRVVMSIGETRFPDGVEAVWLGSIGGAVRWHDGRWESWLPAAYANRIVNDGVRDGDALWVASERGLLRLTRDAAREFTVDNSALPGTSVIALALEPGTGGTTLWAGTHHGLARVRGDRLEVEDLSAIAPEVFVRVLRLTPGADGPHLFAGTDDGLLMRDARGEWSRLPNACLAHASVMDLRERGTPGKDHVLWVASRDGIATVDLDHAFACRTFDDVLAPGVVYQLQFDAAGRIYGFGVDGVVRLSADASAVGGYAVERFSLADGLPGLEFNRASLVDHAGRVWGGSTEGVVLYDPADDAAPAPPRPLRLLAAREEGSGRALNDGTVLAADQNTVAFDFALLSYQRDHLTRYRTQLIGLDPAPDAWSDATQRSYSRLPPGDYTFRVQARDGYGVETAPLALHFHIDTPWWARPWAFALYALALLAFGAGAGRLRARALARRAQALQLEVAERTQSLAEANRQLERASLTDPLTALWNRRYFAFELPAESERALRRARAGEANADLVLLLVDVDHFKRINDANGHAAGDRVLVEVAARLAALTRSGDIALRWGGEEFLIVLRDSSRAAGAAFAERVRLAIRQQPFFADGRRLTVTCSIGWAAYPFRRETPEAVSLEQTIALADQALYRAKQGGRDRAVAADEQDADERGAAG